MSEAITGGDRKRRFTTGKINYPRTPGTFTAGAVLAIALLISIAGSVITYFEVRAAFARHNALDVLQTRLSELFRLQLDEETGIRGLLASGQRIYLEPYTVAAAAFDPAWRRLQDASARSELQSGDVILTDLRHNHDRWEAEVARPLIARPAAPDLLPRLQLGKALVDRMRGDIDALNQLYNSEAEAAAQRMQSLLLRAAISTAVLILLFGCAAIVADLFRSRTQVALDRERTVADTLQRAFLSGWDSVPYLKVGTAYVSSTREAAIGGDLFDIHSVDDHRSLVVVADVSGKGIDAAVETAHVKYSTRTLVEDYGDPGVILSKFNRAFVHSLRDPSSFVSVFIGILDDRDWTLRYASAGHAPAFIRRAAEVEQLPVTGPLAGLSVDAEFSSLTVFLHEGDTIVLATDGLTEARDSSGVQVDDEGVMRWIRDGKSEPQALANELIRRVERFAGGRIDDDLAMLILRMERSAAANAREAELRSSKVSNL